MDIQEIVNRLNYAEKTLRVERWMDHGWCVVERYYDSVGELLLTWFRFTTHSYSEEARQSCEDVLLQLQAVSS